PRRQNHFGERPPNAAATITGVENSAACCGHVGEGQAATAQAHFTDADATDTHTVQIQWGDGTTSTATVNESGGVGTAAGSHVYALGGSYTITISLLDGAASAAATAEARVTGARVHDGMLEVVGTGGDDDVTID